MSTPSKNSRQFSAAPLIVLNLLIVLPLAYYLNIWADEGSTLYTTQHGIAAAFQNAASDERQAPLYFWIMSLWREISGSIFFARLFSIICSAVSIKLFSDLARRLFEPRSALLATAFFALHPILIWASLEIRVYSLVILMSLVLVRLFLDGFFDDDADNALTPGKSRAIFLLTAIIALYTNYYLGFLLVGFFVALVVVRKWRSALIYLGLMAAAGVAFLPLIVTVRSQFLVNTTGFTEEATLIDSVRHIWGHALTFILPADIVAAEETSTAGIVRLWVVRAAILVVGIFTILRWRRVSRRTIAFGAIAGTVFICLFSAYFLVGSWLVALRHASVLFVPIILFTASLFNDIFARKESVVTGVARFAAPIVGVLVLASFSYAILTLYPNMAKRGDWARVGQYIQQHESPNQPIVIYHTFDALVLPFHYKGVNRIFPDERYFDFDFGGPTIGNDAAMKARTDFTLSKVPADAEEIWLIVNDECEPAGACEQLENFVRANYNVVDEQGFYLQRVSLLRKKTR
jgi:uncharacterized membrane protein